MTLGSIIQGSEVVENRNLSCEKSKCEILDFFYIFLSLIRQILILKRNFIEQKSFLLKLFVDRIGKNLKI